MMKLPCILLLPWILASCSAPPDTSPYPRNELLSTPQGVPHDSAVSYFPVEAGVNPNRITPRDTLDSVPFERTLDCQGTLQFASQDMFSFRAPVLYNFFLGRTIYRFLWARSFHPPALLTLTVTDTGGLLTTQSLNKQPGWTATAAEQATKQQHIDGIVAWVHRKGALPTDTARLEAARTETELLALLKSPLRISTAPPVILSQSQVQQFRLLLAAANFWLLPSCQPAQMLDGAAWTLEVHEATRYHIVSRQSPEGKDAKFRRCCEFLLNLSPVKAEERY